jgi:hypothetical protein
VADARRIADQCAPVAVFLAASVVVSFIPEGRTIGLGMLALTVAAGITTAIWLVRRCVIEIPWPYRTVTWTMPDGLFARTASASLELERITNVGVTAIGDDEHQVVFDTTDGERVLLSTNVNLGSLTQASAESRARLVSALIERARGE